MSFQPQQDRATRPAAIFDFDGTLIRTDSTLQLLAFALRRHPGAWKDEALLALALPAWAAGLVSRERLKFLALRVLRSVPPERRDRFFREFHDQVLAPRYLESGVERMRWHRSRGHALVLASASIDLYLDHVARHLGFDLLVCTRAALDPRPRLVGSNCRGSEKVRRLLERDSLHDTDWSESWAYSDSLSDRPLFRLCGHPVATNPGCALRRQARRSGWMIMDW